jgi:hypothetical protein
LKVLIAVLLFASSVMPAVATNPPVSQAPAASPAPGGVGKMTKIDPNAPPEVAMRLALAGTNWVRTEREDSVEGHTVFFTIFIPHFDTWRSKLSHPRIAVWCSKAGMHARIHATGPLKDGNVQIKFDDGKLLQQKWNLVDGLGVPGPADQAALLDHLASTKSLTFQFTPDDAPTQTVTFTMGDYQESVLKEPLCKK